MNLPNIARGNVVRTVDDLRNMVTVILEDYEIALEKLEKVDEEELEEITNLKNRNDELELENDELTNEITRLKEELEQTRGLYRDLYNAYTGKKKRSMKVLEKHRKQLQFMKQLQNIQQEDTIEDEELPF